MDRTVKHRMPGQIPLQTGKEETLEKPKKNRDGAAREDMVALDTDNGRRHNTDHGDVSVHV